MRARPLQGVLGLSVVLGFLAVACSATPPTVAAPKPAPPKKEVPEVKEPEPPPEPLASANVAFEQKWEFVKLSLMDVKSDSDFMPEDEIVKKLPAVPRADYQAVLRAEKQYLAARDRAQNAMSAMFRARRSGQKGPDAAYRLASKARAKARDAIADARVKCQRSLQKAMDKTPSPELGLALARSYTKHVHTDYYDSSRTLGYGFIDQDADSRLAMAPLMQVVGMTSPGDPVGRYVRFELVHHLMATENAIEAESFIKELLGVVSWDKKPLLLLRLGVIQGLKKQHAAAAETFRSAHEHLATSSGLDRKTLLLAEVVARYRALQFNRVLEVAEQHWNEWHDPTPPKPDPNPPPPPPPAPKTAKGKSVASSATTAGILGLLDTSNYGVLGALGSRSTLSDADVLRFATDAVERLERDPAEIKGDPQFRAGIAARLAARALYRSDDVAAKAQGETAQKLGGSASREGLRVLKLLAKRSGDEAAINQIDEALRQVEYGSAAYASGIEHSFVDQELRETKSSGDQPATAAPVERNIRSLVRLCVEPIYQDLPVKAELAVSAKVFPNGKVEPVVEGTSGTAVDACVKQMAGRVLVHAPSSVSAKVALSRLEPADQNAWGGFGSIFGDSIGESFGAGGLGLRGIGEGGGGTGEGIGVGSIGGIGRGGGGGLGGLGGFGVRGTTKKVEPKKPAPKKPKK